MTLLRARAGVLTARIATLLLIIAVVGALPWLSGRDPALSVARARTGELDPTPEALDAVRRELGLDAGPVSLLTDWLSRLARGDFGRSWVTGKEVLPGLVPALGVSLTLMAAALVVGVLLAVAICAPTLARGARGTPGGRAPSGAAAAALVALPEFLLATLLLIVLSVWLGWFPPYGWQGPQHLVLPALAMGIPAGGLLGRLVDDALPAVFDERWVALWRSAGCTPAAIGWAALRRVSPALVPQFGLVVVGITGGAVAVETVFAVPGVGRTARSAAEAQDLPLLQGSVLVLVLLALVAGMLSTAVRHRLLGARLRDAALPVPVRPAVERVSRVLPLCCAGLMAVVIGWGLLREPLRVNVSARLAAPSWTHPLGTDAVGRDVLARIGHGALTTAGVALIVCVCVYVIAMVLGFLPSLAGGAAETMNAVPPLIAGVLVAAAMGPGTVGASIAVVVVSWPPLAAHAAALVQETRAATYLSAQRAIGSPPWWILLRHVLPAVAGPVARHAVLRLPGIALALASLGFLGLGTQPPAPEWGLMLSESLPYVERAPLPVLVPTAMLVLLAALAMSMSTSRSAR